MSTEQTRDAIPKPLRLWPGVVLVIVQWVVRFVLPVVAPDATLFGWRPGLLPLFGGIVCGLAILVWWLLFSRANWTERVGAIVLMIVGLAATSRLAHPSIAGAVGGLLLIIYAIPVLSLALVAWAVASRHLSSGPRRASLVASILFACAVFTLLRSDGVIGVGAELHWRWTKTAEERLLAQSSEPAPAAAEVAKDPLAASADKKPAPEASPTAKNLRVEGPAMSERGVARVEWPGFRGSERDGVIRGVRIKTDWSQSPPVELWRRPIGPGWSSFAVAGDLLYTQEQRGEEEIVSCYRVSTGKPVWRHRDAVRFSESNAGAGPRATPTLNSGLVYTLGATGILNALDASNGAVVWSRNAAKDTGREVPEWGFAGSPLVINDRVIIALYGQLVAYDARTGAPRWVGPPEGAGYSSPHLMTIDGVAQILLLRGSRTTSFAPVDGTVLWEHRGQLGVSIVQPALAAEGDVLIAAGDAADTMGGSGMRRIAVAHGPGGWTVEERWTSRGLKPYFNDFVVHKGHAFGFDGRILASIDLADGTRKWKGGRYGNGQLVLLADQDVLLVLSEEGELALVGATPDQFTELARFQAIEGKTWNHPVLVGDVLLVRNDQEMAAFRLSLTDGR
jgi:outer membrane protein assembly factor BamB